MTEEIWKDIKGYEELYQISNLGRVKSFYKSKKGKIRKNCDQGDYFYLPLRKDGVARNYYIHRLVALNFLETVEGKNEVNHIDGNKYNNRLDNLEWVTSAENKAHAYKTGLNMCIGENHWNAKLSNLKIQAIKELCFSGRFTEREIGEIFEISQSTVNEIKKSKKRADVKRKKSLDSASH